MLAIQYDVLIIGLFSINFRGERAGDGKPISEADFNAEYTSSNSFIVHYAQLGSMIFLCLNDPREGAVDVGE